MIIDQKIKNLGKNVRQARIKSCYDTQESLAEAVDITVDHLQKIEHGSTLPSIPVLTGISKHTNVPIDFLWLDPSSSEAEKAMPYLKKLDKLEDKALDNMVTVLMALYARARSPKK